MLRKTLASVLLLVIAAWAEFALAPLLAMHGHMAPGHETAADMPAHHAHHGMSGDSQKPCCPGFHKVQPEAEFVLLSGAPACEDPHSCCFRQGPQSVPAPVRDVQNLTREIAPVTIAVAIPVLPTARFAPRDSKLSLSPPPDLFGMTLRV
jgi:hypothetical protein